MRAMILAAGFGSRLRPLTDHVPKPLIDVAGHPMIAYPLALLRAAGIGEVIINLHHLGQQIRERLGDGSSFGVSITYSEEDPILDTGGAIEKAREFFRGDTFLVLNADMVIDLDLRTVVEWHRQKDAAVTLVLRDDPEVQRYGAIEIDSEGRIRRFLGRPSTVGVPLRPLMFTGVHVMEPVVFEYMEAGRFSITRDTYPRMLEDGAALWGFRHDGYWRVLDTHENLVEGGRELAQADTLRPWHRP